VLGGTQPLFGRVRDSTGVAHGLASPRIDVTDGAVEVAGGFVTVGDGPASRLHPVVDLQHHVVPVVVRPVEGGVRCRGLRGRAHVGSGRFRKGRRELDQAREVVDPRSQGRQICCRSGGHLCSALVVVEIGTSSVDVSSGEVQPVLGLTCQVGCHGTPLTHEIQLPTRCREMRDAVLLARREPGPGCLLVRILDSLLSPAGVPAQLLIVFHAC